MPTRPPHPCNHVGCPRLTVDRYCEMHRREVRQVSDAQRESSADRGYDRAWRKFRAAYAMKVPPICVDCGRAPAGRQMHLDHIVPMERGGAKYDPKNLAWRCRRCHSKKTAREDGAFGHRGGGGSK